MATVQQVVDGAGKLLGLLSPGESLSAAESSDLLFLLNQMIDSWNTERLMIYQIREEPFSWAAGTISKTIGPTGDFNTTRPLYISDSTFIRDTSVTPNIDYPISIINNPMYDNIPVKSITATYPQVLYYDPGMPIGTIYMYPVSTKTVTLYVNSVQMIGTLALTDNLVLPPGYQRALTYNLAVEGAPFYQSEASPTVQRIAGESKRNVKRINDPMDVLGMPPELTGTVSRFNIYLGN